MSEQPITPDDVLVAYGDSCATLTPRIRERMTGLESGKVLEVRTDDPSSHGDIQAWSRLTGHAVVGVIAEDGGKTNFLVRKK